MTNPAPNPAPNGPTPNVMPGAAAAAAAAPAPSPTPAAPAPTPPAAPAAPVAPAAPAAAPPEAATPPWGDPKDFDPDKAWSLIQNVRAENAGLKGKLADAQPVLDAAEQARRDEQGALATAQEDIARANAEAVMWRNQVVRSAAQTLAGTKGFGVPDAALAMVGDLTDYTTADGLDTDKLGARFDQLAAEYPGLLGLAQAPNPNQPPPRPYGVQPDRGQGQAGTVPSTIDDQIKAAQARGDFTTVIALRQQKAYQAQQQR